jgi:hypothetical protein
VHRSDPPLLHHSGQTTTTTTPPLTVPCHLAHAGTHARAPRSTIALRTHNAATQGQPCSTSMAQTRQQGSRQENNKSSKSLRGVATRTAEISGIPARTTGACGLEAPGHDAGHVLVAPGVVQQGLVDVQGAERRAALEPSTHCALSMGGRATADEIREFADGCARDLFTPPPSTPSWRGSDSAQRFPAY